MNYITTFDAIFFASFCLPLAMHIVQYFFSGKIAKFAHSVINKMNKKEMIALSVIFVLLAIGSLWFSAFCIYKSPEGTLTATFWYTVLFFIFAKRFMAKCNKDMAIAMRF